MKQFIARELRKAERRFGALRVSLVTATSGTAAALTEASQAMRSKSKATGRVARGKPLADTRNVRHLTTKLTGMTNAQRSSVPGIGPRRSEIVVAGAHVYAELLERFALPGFIYSTLGLRDGILTQMLYASRFVTQSNRRWGRLVTCGRLAIGLRGTA